MASKYMITKSCIQDADGIHGGTIWGSIPAYSKTD